MTFVGVGYRPELADVFHGQAPAVDCVELVADRYFGSRGFGRYWELRRLTNVPTLLHGLCGNVASVHGPEIGYLRQISRLADAVDAVAYSDHLAFTGVPGRALGHLAPNLFDDELLVAAARNIARIVAETGRRPCLENLAVKTVFSAAQYLPEEFYLRLLEVCDQWDCLVDLTNVWINSQNRLVDPFWFIDALPAARVRYVHLAGGKQVDGEWIDSHSQPVHDEVFGLLDHLLVRATPVAIIIERDSNWSGAETELRSDLNRVRYILATHQTRSDLR